MLLDGLHVPMTTPFYPDGRVYFRKLEHNADRYSRTPAAGLVVLGVTGEALALNDAEVAEVLTVAAAAAAPEKVLIAGVARESVREAVRVAEQAAAAGYDAVLLRTPGSFPGQRMRGGEASPELLGFYRGVADGSPLPVVLENAPAQTGFDLPVSAVAALAGHGNIPGLCEASGARGRVAEVLAATSGAAMRTVTVTPVFAAVTGRMLRVNDERQMPGGNFVSAETLGGGAALAVAPPKAAMKTRTKDVGFQVIAGGTGNYFHALEEGAAGVMPEFAACAPQACHEVLAAWKDGNPGLAAEKFERIREAMEEMGRRGVGALKFGCDLNGYYGGRPRLPLLAPAGVEQQEMMRLLAGIRN